MTTELAGIRKIDTPDEGYILRVTIKNAEDLSISGAESILANAKMLQECKRLITDALDLLTPEAE